MVTYAPIKVEFLDLMGSDLDVVDAARVSFDKESEWEIKWVNRLNGNFQHSLSDRDKKLIHYLAEHKHTSPFNHAFMKFRVKAPILVARQLVKHEYLIWNEVSRRYVDSDPEFYKMVPRRRADDKKQGSLDEVPPNPDACSSWFARADELGLLCYKQLLELEVAPEQARAVLPHNIMTEWIWSGSLGAFLKMLSLRLAPDSQIESQIVAKEISKHVKEFFPVSYQANYKLWGLT